MGGFELMAVALGLWAGLSAVFVFYVAKVFKP